MAGARSVSPGGAKECCSGTAQSGPASGKRLPAKPAVCRNGIPNSTFPNSTFIVRQARISASLNLCCRPRLTPGGGIQSVSRSNQIESDPRCSYAVVYEGQFLVSYFAGAQLLMPPGCQGGCTTVNPSSRVVKQCPTGPKSNHAMKTIVFV